MRIVSRLILTISFLVTFSLIIAYARGYRIDIKQQKVTPTGILAISAIPKASSVYINGQLKGATDLNLNLPPGRFQVEVKKEGYTSWQKTVQIKPELVISLEATLFPKNPSLSSLTNIGVVKAIPLDQTDKVIIFSQQNNPEQDGIYLFEAGKKPLSLTRPLKTLLLEKALPLENPDFTQANIFFSPDYKQAILELDDRSFLISTEEEEQVPFDVSQSKDTLLNAWEEENGKQVTKILDGFPKEITKIATDSFRIIHFSSDETKILYQAKKEINIPLVKKPPLIGANQTKEERVLNKNQLYLYDKTEDKNFNLSNLLSLIDSTRGKKPIAEEKINQSIQWYHDSKHLVIKGKNKISIVDYDGTNIKTIYSGPFDPSFFSITSDGRILILANLNPETNQFPDLYSVNTK